MELRLRSAGGALCLLGRFISSACRTSKLDRIYRLLRNGRPPGQSGIVASRPVASRSIMVREAHRQQPRKQTEHTFQCHGTLPSVVPVCLDAPMPRALQWEPVDGPIGCASKQTTQPDHPPAPAHHPSRPAAQQAWLDGLRRCELPAEPWRLGTWPGSQRFLMMDNLRRAATFPPLALGARRRLRHHYCV